MRKILLAALALAAMDAGARAQNGVQIQVVPNPQYSGTASHRLACNEWDRCIQVPGFSWTPGSGYGAVSTQNSYFTNGEPPMTGRPGGLEFTRPN